MQTACALMPSSLPVKPRPSSVVAFTLIFETSVLHKRAIFSAISVTYFPIFGFWAITVQSTLPIF